jgi:alkylhydroperoxidase family enzyme
MRAGASEEKVRQVESWETSAHYSDAERVALEFAETMTITGRQMTDELFARARKHYGEAQLVELAAAVALENFRSKFNVALGIEAQGFCTLRS